MIQAIALSLSMSLTGLSQSPLAQLRQAIESAQV